VLKTQICVTRPQCVKNGAVRLSQRLCRLRCSFNVAETSSKAIWHCLTWHTASKCDGGREEWWNLYSEGAETVGCDPLPFVPVPTITVPSSAVSVDRSARTAGPRTLRQQVLPKRRKPLAHRHGVIRQETWSGASAAPLWEPTISRRIFLGFVLFYKYWVSSGTVRSAEHTAHMGAKRAAWRVRSGNVRTYHMKDYVELTSTHWLLLRTLGWTCLYGGALNPE